MKTFLILLLTLTLLLVAVMTRPGRREFVLYLLDTPTEKSSAWSSGAIQHAEKLTRNVTIKDRVLWTSIEKDGKVLYTGVFSHFIPHEGDPSKYTPSVGEMARLLGQVSNEKHK